MSLLSETPYHLLVNWPDDPETNVEVYGTKAEVQSRIAYFRQMDRSEMPKSWEVFYEGAADEDQPVETGP